MARTRNTLAGLADRWPGEAAGIWPRLRKDLHRHIETDAAVNNSRSGSYISPTKEDKKEYLR